MSCLNQLRTLQYKERVLIINRIFKRLQRAHGHMGTGGGGGGGVEEGAGVLEVLGEGR